MHWQTIIELAGYIALTELAALLPAYLLWRVEGSRTCDVTFSLTSAKEFAVHAAETQEVNCQSISAG